MNLNPGIVKTVALLNAHGFPTSDSGDGETHDFECDREEAYVVILLEDRHQLASEADRLRDLLRQHGVILNPVDEDPFVQADYDPANGIACIQLVGCKDSMLTWGD